ncbi:MAG: hypothetical protein J7604_23270 [Sporocytophaga sp.]|uniref:hypothetical protein n=1 Tax=Sporocytophaga sp. TaxID=2231183 RepID=UPI001B2C6D21|nr:hypothetical protein [Sporocytophaga sp.]MBO9703154.1 hypothetical protein [Sporocytophaga sp.]
MKKLLLLILVISFIHFQIGAQNVYKPDSGDNDKALENAVSLYKATIKENLGLYSGSLYVGLSVKTKGFPFFKNEKVTVGNILYDDLYYQNVLLLYDIIRDEVIVEDYSKLNLLKLSGEKISQFSFPGHLFIKLTKDTSEYSIPETGFYELLNNGITKVYVKRKKTIQEVNSNGIIINEIEEKNFYYINIGNGYFPVKSKASLLNVLKEHKKELSRYMKSFDFKYSANRERSILLLVEQFDKLNAK